MPKGRTFRIFLSSTFADLEAERNALHQWVFPRLRDLCQRHGARFQAIDLRWGVRQEASLDQQTMEICLAEIARCRRVTARPNFLVMLGDRYGWCPLPHRIPADELDTLRARLDAKDQQLVDVWYQRDDNAVPPEYRLQPRDSNSEYADDGKWKEVEDRLHSVLAAAAEGSNLPIGRQLVYLGSAVEQEIVAGALQVEAPEEKVFCFFREIEGLPADFSGEEFIRTVEARLCKEQRQFHSDTEVAEVMKTLREQVPGCSVPQVRDLLGNLAIDGNRGELASTLNAWLKEYLGGRYVDLDEQSWENDQEAQARLRDLKARLRQCLPRNSHEHAVQWDGFGISDRHIGQLPETLDACLALAEDQNSPPSLCLDVWRRVSRAILDELANSSSTLAQEQGSRQLASNSALDEEGLAHQAFARERCSHFVGRRDAPRRIAQHVAQLGSGLLVVAGEGGTGKSALLAKAAEEAGKAHPNAQVVSRFIGATPASTDGRSLLEGLIRELDRRYGDQEGHLPRHFNALGMELDKRLARASVEQPLLLFLDALDQLSEAHGARYLAWLPARIPDGARIVVSVRPGTMLDNLEARQVQRATLGSMPQTEGAELLDRWLDKAGRTLQRDQCKEVLEKFESAGGRPLYLRLAFELVRRWTSYQLPERLQPTIPEFIRHDLYARLARDDAHGSKLVSCALGYLTASRYGLAEDELLDLLSRDLDLYADFIGSARHVPSDVLRAIHNHLAGENGTITESDARAWLAESRQNPNRLQGFLGEVLKKPDGPRLPVVLWSRLFFDLEPFLSERSGGEDTLINFFHAELREGAEAICLTGEAVQRLHGRAADYFRVKADPRGDATWAEAYRRGLGELPYHLAKAQQWCEVSSILTNFPFLAAKISAIGPQPLIDDYDLVTSANLPKGDESLGSCQKSLRSIQGALRLSLHVLYQDRTQLRSQLWGRLLPFNNPEIIALRRQIEDWKPLPWVRSVTLGLTPPGRALVRTLIGHSDEIRTITATPDSQRVLSVSYDGICNLWDLETGALLRTIDTGALFNVWGYRLGSTPIAVTPDGRHAVTASERVCSLWDLETGALLRTFANHQKRVLALAVTSDGKRFLSASDDKTCKLWDLETGILLHSFEGHRRKCSAVVLTPDGSRAISASFDDTCKLWDLETGTLLHTFAGPRKEVSAVAVTPDGARVISAYSDGTCRLWDLNAGTFLHTFEGHRKEVSAIAVTPDGSRLISAYSDGTCRLWDLNAGTFLHTFEGHRKEVSAVAVTPDGSRAISASYDGTCRLWELATGSLLHTLKSHPTSVTAIAVTPNGRYAVSGGGEDPWEPRARPYPSDNTTLKVWDLATSSLSPNLNGPQGDKVTAAAVTPDGRRAVLTFANPKYKDGDPRSRISKTSACQLWDLENASLLSTLEGDNVSALALTPNGYCVLSATENYKCTFWDFESHTLPRNINTRSDWIHRLFYAVLVGGLGKILNMVIGQDGPIINISALSMILYVLAINFLLEAFENHSFSAAALAADKSCAFLASGYRFCHHTIWNLENNIALRIAYGSELDYFLRNLFFSVFAAVILIIWCWIYNPDLRSINDGSESVSFGLWWMLYTVSVSFLYYRAFPVSKVTALAMTPDGRYAVSASYDYSCKLFDLKSGMMLHVFKGHRKEVTAVAIPPKGRCAVSGSKDCTCKLWDLESRTLLYTLTGHLKGITAVAVSRDGRRAISASEDCTCKVWSLKTGRLITTFYPDAVIKFISMDSENIFSAVAADGSAYLLEIRTAQLHASRNLWTQR